MSIDTIRSELLPGVKERRWWRAITILIMAAIFLEAFFAGAMLSGVAWARAAHGVNAAVVLAAAIVAGLFASISLRATPQGLKLGLTLLVLAAGAFLQAAIGALSAKGFNLLWIHVPLGVALVGFAGQAIACARQLGVQE